MSCHHCVLIVDDVPGVRRMLAVAQGAKAAPARPPASSQFGDPPDSEPLVLEIHVRRGPFSILRDWFPSGSRPTRGLRS